MGRTAAAPQPSSLNVPHSDKMTRCVVATTSAAWAQERTEPAPTPAVIHYDFETEVIDGRHVGPQERLDQSRTGPSTPSLIEVRRDFRDRILADADAL